MSLQNSIYLPLKISYDTDGLVCVRSPSNGSLNHHLAEREHMISWVRSIDEVFKYSCLICKIWGFTERWITCSENNIYINTETLFFFRVFLFSEISPENILHNFDSFCQSTVSKGEVFGVRR